MSARSIWSSTGDNLWSRSLLSSDSLGDKDFIFDRFFNLPATPEYFYPPWRFRVVMSPLVSTRRAAENLLKHQWPVYDSSFCRLGKMLFYAEPFGWNWLCLPVRSTCHFCSIKIPCCWLNKERCNEKYWQLVSSKKHKFSGGVSFGIRKCHLFVSLSPLYAPQYPWQVKPVIINDYILRY